MIILFLDLLYPSWGWQTELRRKFAELEVVLIDLPILVVFAIGFVSRIGG